MKIFLYISISFFLIGIFLFLFLMIFGRKNKIVKEKGSKNPKFAILIPARDESLVIESLLKSIKKQTRKIPMEDVFVIVETKEDKTVQICQKWGATVIIRKHLEKKSKGYALEEGIEYLVEKGKYYDAYFIFDADNILDPHYLEEMEQDYQEGYAMSTGYRNLKNGNECALATSSGLTYWIINEWKNKKGLKQNQNILLSGTGFYLHGKYIKEWKTYPFHTLTEDVELSFYGTLHGLSSHYNERAIFFDEQPNHWHASILQRKRWIRGFFQNWFHYAPKFRKQLKQAPNNSGSLYHMMLDIPMILFFVLGIVSFLIYVARISWLSLLCFLLFLYFLLVAITCLIYLKDNGKLKINPKQKYISVWHHPIFLITYIYAFVLSIFEKNIGWDKIEHGVSKKD